MNRWAARIVGLIMLLFFLLIFTSMYKTLKTMERQQQGTTTSRP
jgi:hypothetical protein